MSSMTPKKALKILSNSTFRVSNEADEHKCRMYQVVFKTAIAALEKQIPKKVIKSKTFLHGKRTVDVALCPNCNGSLGLYNFAKTSFKCCCECGQALDWSDTE